MTTTRSRGQAGRATSARDGRAPSRRPPLLPPCAAPPPPARASLAALRSRSRAPPSRPASPPWSPSPSQPARSHHVFASRGEARDESRTSARRESRRDAHRAETPTFGRHQRGERQGRPGVGEPQPAQTDRVHLRRDRPGRQRLPAGSRAGGSPEAPRLLRQASFPETPAHPAASQVNSKAPHPPPAVPRRPDLWYFPDKENWRFLRHTALLGNLRQSEAPLPLP